MTLISAIITKGYREAGILGLSDAVSSAQQTEALDRLQAIFKSLFGNELGEQLTSVNYGVNGLTNYYGKDVDKSFPIDAIYLPANLRVILNISAAKTLYLDPQQMDGARLGFIDASNNLGTYNVTLNGNGRLINNATTALLNTNGTNTEYLYRADLGSWQPVTTFIATDQSPLPQEFDDLLSTGLAFRLNPAYGAQTSAEMADVTKRMIKNFRARYRQNIEYPVEGALVRLPSNKFLTYNNSTAAFNRGNIA